VEDSSGMDKNNLRYEALDIKRKKSSILAATRIPGWRAHNTMKGFDKKVYYEQQYLTLRPIRWR
jgi:hypothetical protein